MGITIEFHQPFDYLPEIPAGTSCHQCVFVTNRVMGFKTVMDGVPHEIAPAAICRHYTKELSRIVWLTYGNDGNPERCVKCLQDFPYGASFQVAANPKPLSEVEKAARALLSPVRLYLTETQKWQFEDANHEARKMIDRLVAAVKAEK